MNQSMILRQEQRMPKRQIQYMTEPELQEFMRNLAMAIEFVAENENVEKINFTLVVWNDPKIGQYIANVSRENMTEALRELANRLETQTDLPRSGDHGKA
jgi:hypothetical protein